MAKVPRPVTAFALSGGMKRPRRTFPGHLEWVRTLPSAVSGVFGVEAAHIRFGSLPHGKRETGVAEKPSDCWVLPLTPGEHRKQHSMNEREFWKEAGIHPLTLAALLFTNTGDDEAGRLIIRNARTTAPWRD